MGSSKVEREWRGKESLFWGESRGERRRTWGESWQGRNVGFEKSIRWSERC